MILEALAVGDLPSNAYVVGCEETRAALLVDAGGDAERIIACCRERELSPTLLVNTHGHVDHIVANAALKEAFPGLKLAIHAADARMLTSATANLSFFLGARVVSPAADRLMEDGQRLDVGRLAFTVIHTPGHTPGGICLLHEPGDASAPLLFTGDTLFAGGIGRTDFPGGDQDQLLAAIRDRILTLDERTIIYPGHGPRSTVGEEKRDNPFLGQG